MATKSLGVLTLDLIAKVGGFITGMDKAGRASEKWRKQAEKDAKVIGKAIGAAAGTISVAATAIVVSTVRASNEINRLAQVSNVSATTFQKYAAGAKVVGIEQQKLADIFKDTNDKVGDFLQTGGGALADFFENIAPKIGVTAEQFRNLSGPDALQLYVSSLEKANVSQNEMTFFLEAIASDATLLLPLLKNNAEGFKLFGDQAERLGAIIGEDTLQATDKLNAAMFLFDQTNAGLQNQIAGQLIPTLADLAVGFETLTVNGALAEDIGRTLSTVLKGLTAGAFGAFAGIQLLGKGIGGIGAIIASGFGGNAVDVVVDDLEDTAQRYATALKTILSAGDGDGSGSNDGRLAQIAKFLKDSRDLSGQTTVQVEKLGDALEEIQVKAFDNSAFVERLEKAIEIERNYKDLVSELRTEDERLTDQLRERLAVLDAIGTISDAERTATAGRVASAAFTSSPDFGGIAPEVGGAFGELLRINEAESELDQWYADQIDRLARFRAERQDLNEQWNDQEAALTQEHQERLAKIEQARQLASLSAAESLFGNLADITRQFAGEQSGIYKALFVVQKAAAIAQSLVAIQTGIALASANPFPANLAAMASVAAATASIIGTISSTSIRGVAHDGLMSVPQTGTYLLERGERVTTSDTSAKLDRTLDDVKMSMEQPSVNPQQIRIVNAWDMSMIGDYMGSASGEQVIMNAVRRNQRTIKSLAA